MLKVHVRVEKSMCMSPGVDVTAESTPQRSVLAQNLPLPFPRKAGEGSGEVPAAGCDITEEVLNLKPVFWAQM